MIYSQGCCPLSWSQANCIVTDAGARCDVFTEGAEIFGDVAAILNAARLCGIRRNDKAALPMA